MNFIQNKILMNAELHAGSKTAAYIDGPGQLAAQRLGDPVGNQVVPPNQTQGPRDGTASSTAQSWTGCDAASTSTRRAGRPLALNHLLHIHVRIRGRHAGHHCRCRAVRLHCPGPSRLRIFVDRRRRLEHGAAARAGGRGGGGCGIGVSWRVVEIQFGMAALFRDAAKCAIAKRAKCLAICTTGVAAPVLGRASLHIDCLRGTVFAIPVMAASGLKHAPYMKAVKESDFAHLQVRDEQLVRLGLLAERYFAEDPNTCLLKLRQQTELLAQLLASKVGRFTEQDSCCTTASRQVPDTD